MKEMIPLLDKIGTYKADELVFQVRIQDVRWDRYEIQYLVVPVAGKGESWVSHYQVDLSDPSSSQ